MFSGWVWPKMKKVGGDGLVGWVTAGSAVAGECPHWRGEGELEKKKKKKKKETRCVREVREKKEKKKKKWCFVLILFFLKW
jgi:hypothetical protein